MFRVNYNAERFGFVGWEVFTSKDNFTSKDKQVMNDCVKIACSQMSKMLEEVVTATIIEI